MPFQLMTLIVRQLSISIESDLLLRQIAIHKSNLASL
jgi:hypothetical protein